MKSPVFIQKWFIKNAHFISGQCVFFVGFMLLDKIHFLLQNTKKFKLNHGKQKIQIKSYHYLIKVIIMFGPNILIPFFYFDSFQSQFFFKFEFVFGFVTYHWPKIWFWIRRPNVVLIDISLIRSTIESLRISTYSLVLWWILKNASDKVQFIDFTSRFRLGCTYGSTLTINQSRDICIWLSKHKFSQHRY